MAVSHRVSVFLYFIVVIELWLKGTIFQPFNNFLLFFFDDLIDFYFESELAEDILHEVDILRHLSSIEETLASHFYVTVQRFRLSRFKPSLCNAGRLTVYAQ